jgi:hypothetical protein
MAGAEVSEALRNAVRERAKGRCEYCLTAEVARKRGQVLQYQFSLSAKKLKTPKFKNQALTSVLSHSECLHGKLRT